MAFFAKMAEPTRVLPAEFVGKVVSRPLTCLPTVSATTMRSATELALGGRGLEVLEGFALFPNLECLWLQDNALTALEGLDTNVRIRRLYASRNRIASLQGSLLAFKHLEELDLSDNVVSNLNRCLETLELFLLLRKLWLKNNPVAQEVDYRARVLARLPSLQALDNVVVTDVEREEAARLFGSGAKGGTAVRAAFQQRIKWRDAGRVFCYDNVPENSGLGAGAQGGHAPNVGFGRSSGTLSGGGGGGGGATDAAAPGGIVFGVSKGLTTIQSQFQREVEGVQRRRLERQLERTAQEFADAKLRGDWAHTMGGGDSSASSSSSAPLVVSALINISHPTMSEDLVTRRIRSSMLARNVEPELLTVKSPYRREGAATTGVAVAAADAALGADAGSARAQMLSALAPIVPMSRATHPIFDPLFTGVDGPAPSSASSLSASLPPGQTGGPPPVFRANGTMSASLAATLSSTGVRPITEAQLAKMVLSKTGLRLKANRPRSETLARYGLDAFGNVISAADAYTAGPPAHARAGAGAGASAGAGPGHAGAAPPLLPTIDNGRLGAWDRYKLRKSEWQSSPAAAPCMPLLPAAFGLVLAAASRHTQFRRHSDTPFLTSPSRSRAATEVFQESDADGSGELSRDEIKAALSACADYGFVVQGESSSGGDMLGSSAALLGTTKDKGAGSARSQELLDAIFDAIDVDKSGTVTWREFIDVVETGVVATKKPSDKEPAAGKKGGKKGGALSSRPASPTSARTTARPASPSPRSPSPTATARSTGGRAKTAAEVAKEKQAAMLEQATTLLASARKKKAPEPLRVPQLRFRSLTASEAAMRASRYFKQAAEAWRAHQRVAPDAHDRELQWSRLRAEMVAAGERANRLDSIAQALGGQLDPPERAPTPPRQRHDFAVFTSLAPAREEARRLERGMRHYRVPFPGDEVSADEERSRAVLNPGPLALAEEEEQPELRLKRLTAASLVMRTLGDPLFENYRIAQKAKAPHALHMVKQTL
jgi:Leucine-rich repeat (LRR) protein